MALAWNEIKDRALAFSRDWTKTELEDADAKPFWNRAAKFWIASSTPPTAKNRSLPKPSAWRFCSSAIKRSPAYCPPPQPGNPARNQHSNPIMIRFLDGETRSGRHGALLRAFFACRL